MLHFMGHIVNEEYMNVAFKLFILVSFYTCDLDSHGYMVGDH